MHDRGSTPSPTEEISSERQFLENLLNQRANFAFVVFGLGVAAAASVETPLRQTVVLAVSAFLSALLAVATSRAQWKLDLMFRELSPRHPAKTTDALTRKNHAQYEQNKKLVPWPFRLAVKGSRRRLVGY